MNAGIIDYGAGNLRSVANAVRATGADPTILSSPADFDGITHLILPGVGSFGDCMEELHRRELVAPILRWLARDMPYLGICLGYQILFTASEESPGTPGLDVLPGTVRRFQPAPGLKIPHMGWNSISISKPASPLWQGLDSEPFFYFVHSYFPVPSNEALVASRTGYGMDTFASSVGYNRVLATQFHPEKSQQAGIQLLRNFLSF